METILELKEAVKNFYGKYDAYLISVFKFLLALCAFLTINMNLGYMERLNSFLIMIILALFCSFLPLNAIVLIGSGLVAGHLYALSLEAFLVGGGLVLILLLLYFGIAPKESLAILLTPVACAFHVPCAAPLVLGLSKTPFSGVGVAIGTIGYYGVLALSRQATDIKVQSKDAAEAMLQRITGLLDAFLKNPEMVIAVITSVVVVVMVYVIRRMAIKYAWSIGILLGALIYLLSTLMGQVALGAAGNIIGVVIGTAVSILIAFIVKLFLFQMDYKKVQNVQFEDDEYYYYVKAVPKMMAKPSHKTGREESVRASKNEGRRGQERPEKSRRRGSGRSDLDIQDY